MNNILRPQDFNKDQKQAQIDYLRVQVEALKVTVRDMANSFSALCRHLGVDTPALQKAFEEMLKERAEKDKKIKEMVKAP